MVFLDFNPRRIDTYFVVYLGFNPGRYDTYFETTQSKANPCTQAKSHITFRVTQLMIGYDQIIYYIFEQTQLKVI